MKKQNSTTISFQNLAYKGYISQSKHGFDYFAQLVQWMQKSGYNEPLRITGGYWDIIARFESWFQDALFSFKASDETKAWRNSLYYFGTKIKGLDFYRNTQKQNISNYPRVYSHCLQAPFGEAELLKAAFNPRQKKAVYILKKSIVIFQNYFYYEIMFGEKGDYENYYLPAQLHSSWSFYIKSDEGENLFDFVTRLNENYEAILAKDETVLLPFVGGNYYTLKTTAKYE